VINIVQTHTQEEFMKIFPAIKLSFWIIYFALFLMLWSCKSPAPKDENLQDFRIEEITIAEIHDALKTGKITCRKLVKLYLERITAYDQPLELNSLVVINPHAIEQAEELDKEFARTKVLRPLHGIPLIVKDNYDTYDSLPDSKLHRRYNKKSL
jgi:hypothetical protein